MRFTRGAITFLRRPSTRTWMRLIRTGVIPIIFAISLWQFPQTMAQFTTVEWLRRSAGMIQPRLPLGAALYFILIILFTYFYMKRTTDGDRR